MRDAINMQSACNQHAISMQSSIRVANLEDALEQLMRVPISMHSETHH